MSIQSNVSIEQVKAYLGNCNPGILGVLNQAVMYSIKNLRNILLKIV